MKHLQSVARSECLTCSRYASSLLRHSQRGRDRVLVPSERWLDFDDNCVAVKGLILGENAVDHDVDVKFIDCHECPVSVSLSDPHDTFKVLAFREASIDFCLIDNVAFEASVHKRARIQVTALVIHFGNTWRRIFNLSHNFVLLCITFCFSSHLEGSMLLSTLALLPELVAHVALSI
jgi:hypothetical protein